jgi:glycine betaine/proline transport system ATP-binding protein
MDAVIFNKVNIVFGPNPELALPLMDQGMSRSDIRQQTGQIWASTIVR